MFCTWAGRGEQTRGTHFEEFLKPWQGTVFYGAGFYGALLKQTSRNPDEADNPVCFRFLISASLFPRSSAMCQSLFLSPP